MFSKFLFSTVFFFTLCIALIIHCFVLVGSVLIVFMNKFEQWHMVESGYFDLFGDFLRLNLTIGNSFLNFIGGVFTLAAAVCGMAYVSSLSRVAESNDEDSLQNQQCWRVLFKMPIRRHMRFFSSSQNAHKKT